MFLPLLLLLLLPSLSTAPPPPTESTTSTVTSHYTLLPYPPRDPLLGSSRLISSVESHPSILDHVLHPLARVFTGPPRPDPLRVLVAGGGTGDVTVYLAETYFGSTSSSSSKATSTAHIHHLDLSPASVEVRRSHARAKRCERRQHYYILRLCSCLGSCLRSCLRCFRLM